MGEQWAKVCYPHTHLSEDISAANTLVAKDTVLILTGSVFSCFPDRLLRTDLDYSQKPYLGVSHA